MSVRIDAQELSEILSLTPEHQNVMLVGNHGIGKSQFVAEYFERQGQKVIAFFLGQMSDPGDLIGLMHKNETTGHSEFLPPYWWPLDDEPVVLFLDELNRARPEILQSVMDLTLNRKLAGRSLPMGSRVVAAVNEGDEYQLTDLDPALVSRFNVYEFAPTVDDWLVWASSKEIDVRVINFIQQHQEYLDGDPRAADTPAVSFGNDLSKSPDRRAWEKVSHLLRPLKQIEDVHIKLLAGTIGTSAAMAFVNSLRNAPTVSGEDLLLRFGKSKQQLKSFTTPDFAALNERVVLRIQKGRFAATTKKKVLTNFRNYVQLLLDLGQSEACAHLAATLEKPQYEKASLFVLADQKILDLLVEFIEGIKLD